MAKNKYQFFSEILETKRIEPIQKERLLKMMAAELRTSEFDEESVLERIRALEKSLGHNQGADKEDTPRDVKLKTSETSERSHDHVILNTDNEKSNLTNTKSSHQIKWHNPRYTVEFLKNFKYDNDTGLKELVHKPYDDNFDFRENIERVTNHPLFIDKFHGKRTDEFITTIPAGLWGGTFHLIELLKTKGIEFFNKKGKHPMENPEIAKEIQSFKRDYRFGSEKSEYSVLKDLIVNVANKVSHFDSENNLKYSFGYSATSNLFSLNQLSFLPNAEKFTLRAGFFTWVPYIRNSLSWIFSAILQHSNIDDEREFNPKAKKITIEAIRQRQSDQDFTTVKLIISDEGSIYKGDPTQLHEALKNSKLRNIYLFGIADWSVEFDTIEEKAYRIDVLPESDKIVDLKQPVKAFRHILTFYD